jgi:hypothetical protein
MSRRAPDPGARRALAWMLVLTPVIAIGVLVIPGLDVTARSVILIAWMAVMITVMRRA